jgi:hypothetical protein
MLQRVALRCDEARIAWNTLLICLAFCERDFASAIAASASFALRGSVHAKPLAKPIRYRPVTREIEAALVRAYREDGDIDALNWLAGAHRPMVVTMAQNRWWGGNGTSLAALVEYGMLGLRLAAEPLRPSRTKKGQLVGFDPAAGHRFSTYARHYAEKEMGAALYLDPAPERSSELAAKAQITADGWHRAPSLFRVLPNVPSLLAEPGYYAGVFLHLVSRRPAYHKSFRPWTLWKSTVTERKLKPRNHLKHPITATERGNRRAFYLQNHLVLETFKSLTEDYCDDANEGDSGSPVYT